MRFRIEIHQKRNPELFKLLLKYGFNAERVKRPPREDFEIRCKRIMDECTSRKVYVNDLSGADYNFYRKAIAKHGDNPIVREMENKVIQFRNDDKLHPRNMNYCNNMIADVRRIGAMGYVIPTSSRYSNWYRGQIGYQLRNNIPKPDWYDELKEVAHIFTNKDNKYDKSLKRWSDDIKLDDEPQK